jgi:hypothetical protein
LALVVAFATAATALQQSGVPRTADLSAPRVDVTDAGKTVISLTASGNLKGVVTFQLHRGADGTLTGDWAFTVAHVDNTDPATGREPDPEAGHDHGDGEHHHPHRDYVTMVHRGALAGTITGAELTFDSDGALASLSASLTIAQGSSEFEGATGSGQATLDALTLFF